MYMLKSPEGITFNHIDLQERFTDADNALYDYFMVNDVAGRGVNGKEIELITVSNNDGAYVEGGRKPPRYLDVTITVKSPSFSDLRRKIDELNDILNTREDVPIVFDDETDMTYFGRLDSVNNLTEEHKIYQAVLTFLCSDPYKYGPEVSKDLGDIDTVNNEGTVSADPIFELTAMEKATFAMISNGADEDAEYNLIGTPADVDEKLVDEKTLIFDEIGDSIEAWDVPTSGFTGNFASDTNGIYVDSYGSGDGWHGPALMREIDPIDDFEIEFYVRVRTEQPEMAFRTSLNFYDENNNDLGLLRLWNKSSKQISKVVEARVGPYTGTTHENYLISSQNYSWVGQRAYNGIIRVSRKGNVYTFYASHISQRGNHIESITEKYIDNSNDFAGRLKFIRIDAAIYGDSPTPNALSISRVKVTRHNEILVDETPYIIFPGDKVTLDHKNEDLLLNGEPRNDLKNFGGSFFKLKKGYNSLIVHPSDTFDSKVIYSNKYL